MEFFTKTFANCTSGNEIIDKFIQKKQIEYEYYEIKWRGKKIHELIGYIGAIFEWIPYDKFIEVKETTISDFATAVWKEGPLSYDGNDEEWIRSSYKKVILKYLYDSKNITDEFINEVNSYLLFKGNYGISQNPDTKDYILVFSKENFELDYCKKCGDKYECDYEDYKSIGQYCKDKEYNWSIWKEGRLRYDIIKKEWMKKPYKKVVLKYLNSQNITDEFFKEVTVLYDSYGISQNMNTKEYILKMQLKISNESSCVFEWIPYSELSEIKEIGDNRLTTAIWNKGSLNYNTHDKKWMRASYKKVCLKYLYYSQNITDEFIIKIESYLTNEIYYGVSQNQDTKVYILVFNNDYLDKRCEKCGNEYEDHDQKWCKCYMEYLKDDITNRTSGNEKLDGLIQKYQLKYGGDGTVFEWISYNEFVDVKEIRKGDFAIAIWTDGSLYYSIPNRKFKRKSNKKVLLKYLNNSRNNDDFLNKIPYLMENSYGISQDPNTKDYILVYNIGYYCESCGKKYNKFEVDNKSCGSCQTYCENEKINDLIQEMKLNIDHNSSYSYKMFEWIPYDRFFDIKEIGKGGFSTVYSAIWKDGLLNCVQSSYHRSWNRNPNTRVALKCLHNSQDCIDGFINEVKGYSDQKIYNCWDPNPENRPFTIDVKEKIELFYNSLDRKFKKEEQHHEIEEQFKETQESRKEHLLSIKNNKQTTHTHAVYSSRLLNPFTKNLFNSTVEITDFTNM
ncbi:kinase-like domain-containing protein [Rhizophagus clarus]|uniref:Kinase-like domain-containing protein n=1 Tax=Rhizophagus clarus TaxID=94130 RepID=A0A8H3LYE6_9GLOM|nr:kinase-like domain-containing protein [Rhizophagus clarus]